MATSGGLAAARQAAQTLTQVSIPVLAPISVPVPVPAPMAATAAAVAVVANNAVAGGGGGGGGGVTGRLFVPLTRPITNKPRGKAFVTQEHPLLPNFITPNHNDWPNMTPQQLDAKYIVINPRLVTRNYDPKHPQGEFEIDEHHLREVYRLEVWESRTTPPKRYIAKRLNEPRAFPQLAYDWYNEMMALRKLTEFGCANFVAGYHEHFKLVDSAQPHGMHPPRPLIYVMEEVSGDLNLLKVLDDSNQLKNKVVRYLPLLIGQVVQIGMQLLTALSCMHSMGITHNDVAERNIMLFDWAAVPGNSYEGKLDANDRFGVKFIDLGFAADASAISRNGGGRPDVYARGAFRVRELNLPAAARHELLRRADLARLAIIMARMVANAQGITSGLSFDYTMARLRPRVHMSPVLYAVASVVAVLGRQNAVLASRAQPLVVVNQADVASPYQELVRLTKVINLMITLCDQNSDEYARFRPEMAEMAETFPTPLDAMQITNMVEMSSQYILRTMLG